MADSQYAVYVGLLWAGVKRLVAAGVVLIALLAVAILAASQNTTSPRTKSEIFEAETRTAVAVSGARIVRLRVIEPNRSFSVSIRVSHPARFLLGRVNRLVSAFNRLTYVQRRFQHRSFAVFGPSGRVFWFDQTRTPSRETTHWSVRLDLMGCIRLIPLSIEVDPYHAASPCPRLRSDETRSRRPPR